MKASQMQTGSANIYRPGEYWTNVARGRWSDDATGFAPVLHPHAPAWFNRLIDDLQFRALRRALTLADVRAGASVLDVGCGTGRWLRRYLEMGFNPMGVDATPPMLRLARERGTAVPMTAGQAQHLPFADARFDCVSDITVVQHIPTAFQSEALSEMVRVLKPAGRLILMELIRGEGSHVFPRHAQSWIDEVGSLGPRLVGWFGQEFLLFDRLFVNTIRTITPKHEAAEFSEDQTPRHASLSRSAYWAMRRVTASLSGWLDPAIAKVAPQGTATHGVFVFRKEQ